MKKNLLKSAVLVIAVSAIAMAASCTSSSSSTKEEAAAKYIQDLENTLQLHGIDIDDTVGSGDAYAAYYNL